MLSRNRLQGFLSNPLVTCQESVQQLSQQAVPDTLSASAPLLLLLSGLLLAATLLMLHSSSSH
jgi:hypothetical protein